MYEFRFQNTTKVLFGDNVFARLAKETVAYGKKILLVYGKGSIKKNGLYEKTIGLLHDEQLEVYELSGIDPNPKLKSVELGTDLCRKESIEVIVAVGGGSVIDCAKAISGSVFYKGDCWDIITGKATINKALPIIAVPTTAATGSEMNGGGLINNEKENDKHSFGHPLLQPAAAFINPVNTYSLDHFNTACGGVDIISHILEGYYFSDKDKMYLSEKMMECVIKTVLKFTPDALKNGCDYTARANLMWASSWAMSGFLECGGNCRPICHIIEHKFSAYYDITHGLGIAIILPKYMRYIKDHNTAPIFKSMGVNVFDIDISLDDLTAAEKTIEKLEDFFYNCLKLESSFSQIGIDVSLFETIANELTANGSLMGLKLLDKKDIMKILYMCL